MNNSTVVAYLKKNQEPRGIEHWKKRNKGGHVLWKLKQRESLYGADSAQYVRASIDASALCRATQRHDGQVPPLVVEAEVGDEPVFGRPPAFVGYRGGFGTIRNNASRDGHARRIPSARESKGTHLTHNRSSHPEPRTHNPADIFPDASGNIR